MALNKLVKEVFPKTTFAFYGNHINRYKQKVLKNVKHQNDLLRKILNLI